LSFGENKLLNLTGKTELILSVKYYLAEISGLITCKYTVK